jgi:DNA topoisomerase IA
VPTFTGGGVVQLRENNFSTMGDYGFPSTMEDGVARISTGGIDELQFLKDFY